MGFVGRFWRGELPLLTSALAVGLVGLAVAAALFRLIVVAASFLNLSLAAIAVTELVWFVACGLLWLLGSVGVWRAAAKANLRAKLICRACVIALTLALVPNAMGSFQAARELSLIAAHRDPLGGPAEVTGQGAGLQVRGLLAQGTADRFEGVLGRFPNARLVTLTSEGGRIAEAVAMAEVIRHRGMDTVAIDECSSACTLVLLAGRKRSASKDTLIGFHQATMDGNSRLDDKLHSENMRAAFEERGIAKAFVERAFSTNSDDLWMPSEQEMVAARFLTARAVENVSSPASR